MVNPIRIQRKRTKGWNMQLESVRANGLRCVNVARPTRWGNPWSIKGCIESGCAEDSEIARILVVEAFRASVYEYLNSGVCRYNSSDPIENIVNYIHELEGKNLACFCPLDKSCHADILLELANPELLRTTNG